MADKQDPGFTQEELQSLAEKLTQLKPSLSEGEQRAFRAIIARAATSGSHDVAGFTMDDHAPAEVALAVGQTIDLTPTLDMLDSAYAEGTMVP